MRKVSLPISGHCPRRAAKHLLIEDAAVDAPDKDKVLDARHVDAGRQEIDRDGDLRQRVIAERADEIADAVHAARDLADGGVLDLAVGARETPSSAARRRYRHGHR